MSETTDLIADVDDLPKPQAGGHADHAKEQQLFFLRDAYPVPGKVPGFLVVKAKLKRACWMTDDEIRAFREWKKTH